MKELLRASWITGVIELKAKDLPKTYLFKTSRGEMGSWKSSASLRTSGWHGEDQKGYGMKIRYKLVQPMASGSGASNLKEKPATPGNKPVPE